MTNHDLQTILRKYPPDTDINIYSYDWNGEGTLKTMQERDIHYDKSDESLLLDYDPPRKSENYQR